LLGPLECLIEQLSGCCRSRRLVVEGRPVSFSQPEHCPLPFEKDGTEGFVGQGAVEK
jgi:hypothetical protein